MQGCFLAACFLLLKLNNTQSEICISFELNGSDGGFLVY